MITAIVMAESLSVLPMTSDASAPVAVTPSLGMTMGSILFGVMITTILYGISIPQLVMYYTRYSKDPRLFRYSIGFFWILDTVQLGLAINTLYFYLVSSHGDYQVLLQFNWSIRSQYTVTMVVIVGVQALYAVRIWKFGRHFHAVLPWCAFLSVAASLATGIYAVYVDYGPHNILSLPSIKVSIDTVYATTAATDLIIAGITCFYLHMGREMTCMPSTINIIVALMRLVIMSGLVTSICSLLVLISYIVWPNTLLFIAFELALPNLYINSLLAMLNSRKISTKLAVDLGLPVSAPESGTVLEFAPNKSGDTAV